MKGIKLINAGKLSEEAKHKLNLLKERNEKNIEKIKADFKAGKYDKYFIQ